MDPLPSCASSLASHGIGALEARPQESACPPGVCRDSMLDKWMAAREGGKEGGREGGKEVDVACRMSEKRNSMTSGGLETKGGNGKERNAC